MSRDEIKAKLTLLATAVLAAEGKSDPANADVIATGTEAGFDLAADFLHNIGRIADAVEHIARNVPPLEDRAPSSHV